MRSSWTPSIRRHSRPTRFNRLLPFVVGAALVVGIANTPVRAQQFDNFVPVTDAVLQDPYRSTVLAHYYQDEPLVEIAHRLDLPASTVRWRQGRSRRRLWSMTA